MTIGEDIRESLPRKHVHLAVQLPGAGPRSAGRIDVDALVHLVRSAERGLFDFAFLPTGPGFTMLAALAGVCDRLGLVGAVDATVTEPFDLARQLATLDHLSDGRAGWQLGHPGHGDDHARAAEFVAVVRAFWDCWHAGAVVADERSGTYVDPERIHEVAYHGDHFDVRGTASLPAGPQGYPILLQSGAEDAGARDFGARYADAVVMPHATLAAGRGCYADVRARAAAYGRGPNEPVVFSAVRRLAGTPDQVAAEMDLRVQSDACDGFMLGPHLDPRGLDDVVDAVVPLLRQRGVFRAAYDATTDATTLRERLCR